jgi:alpha-D-ribose 1-methylphosphonate 5-triphosphate synthase subunit PhnH
MSALLTDLGTAMSNPVAGTQGCFRAALEALSRPGRIVALPAAATAGLRVPATRAHDGTADVPMTEATAALLLTLIDAECAVRLHGAFDHDAMHAWLRFHTGARVALPGQPAAFTVSRAADLRAAQWEALDLGSDEAPQRGGTLIVEAPRLAAPQEELVVPTAAPLIQLQLRGPGIETEQALAVGGLPEAFWRHRIALEPQFPRGFELLLTRGRWLAAIPRSTRITIQAAGA